MQVIYLTAIMCLIVGCLSWYDAFSVERNTGPLEYHAGSVVKFEKWCGTGNQVDFYLEVLIGNEVFKSENGSIGFSKAGHCRRGKPTLRPSKINDLKPGDSVEVITDRNRRVYIYYYSNFQHFLFVMTCVGVLIALFLYGKYTDRERFENRIRGISD